MYLLIMLFVYGMHCDMEMGGPSSITIIAQLVYLENDAIIYKIMLICHYMFRMIRLIALLMVLINEIFFQSFFKSTKRRSFSNMNR